MTSTKPYLLRAIYEWCVDQGLTPYLQIIVDGRTKVPMQYVKDGQIVLNVGPTATQNVQMGNEEITFQARFNGVVFSILVPVDRVAAIYARENGQGMGFEVQTTGDRNAEPDNLEAATDELPVPETPPPSTRPTLTRIK